MKAILVLAVTLVSASAFASLSQPMPLSPAPESPILMRGEQLNQFTARVRSELTCENLTAKLNDYNQTRSQHDQAVADSFNAVSNSLDQWDAELYRVVGRQGFRYTGALGQYARRVDEYAYELGQDQLKLNTYITLFNERLTECTQRAR